MASSTAGDNEMLEDGMSAKDMINTGNGITYKWVGYENLCLCVFDDCTW